MLCYQESRDEAAFSKSHNTTTQNWPTYTAITCFLRQPSTNFYRLSNPLSKMPQNLRCSLTVKKSNWLWLIMLHFSILCSNCKMAELSGPKRCQNISGLRGLHFLEKTTQHSHLLKHTETPSHACVLYTPIEIFKSCTLSSSNNPHTKSQNIPSWKGPERLIKSNSWNPELLDQAQCTLI